MASNHWVRDRVLDWLAKDSTIGAKALKTKLEEQSTKAWTHGKNM